MKHLRRLNESTEQAQSILKEVEECSASLYDYLEDIGIEPLTDLVINQHLDSTGGDSFITIDINDINKYKGDRQHVGVRIYFVLDKNKKDSSTITWMGDDLDKFSKILGHINLMSKKLRGYYFKVSQSTPLSWPGVTFEILVTIE
jgi:hypothetical protein